MNQFDKITAAFNLHRRKDSNISPSLFLDIYFTLISLFFYTFIQNVQVYGILELLDHFSLNLQ